MSKDAIHVKSNGLRNELKEIRKSIDKLTNVFHHIVDIWANDGFNQTNEQYEKDYYYRKHRHSGELRKPEHNDG